MEHRMKCNVCGKIWCYEDPTTGDAVVAFLSATTSAFSTAAAISSADSGNWGAARVAQELTRDSNDLMDSVSIKYKNQCPSCNSHDVFEIPEGEDISKYVSSQNKKDSAEGRTINSNASVESLLKRVQMFMEDEVWDQASFYCEQILDINPECAMAYVDKLMIAHKISKQEDLGKLNGRFDSEKDFQRAISFAEPSLKNTLVGYNDAITARKNEEEYTSALSAYENAGNEGSTYEKIAERLRKLGDYKDSSLIAAKCDEMARSKYYDTATSLYRKAQNSDDYLRAKSLYEKLGYYKDSRDLAIECMEKAEQFHKAKVARNKKIIVASALAIIFVTIAIIATKYHRTRYVKQEYLKLLGQKMDEAIESDICKEYNIVNISYSVENVAAQQPDSYIAFVRIGCESRYRNLDESEKHLVANTISFYVPGRISVELPDGTKVTCRSVISSKSRVTIVVDHSGFDY